jgi:membrane protein YqaA with SNARE-associated domain
MESSLLIVSAVYDEHCNSYVRRLCKWFVEHVKGVSTVFVWALFFVGVTSIPDPLASVSGWGPRWIGPFIILGAIVIASVYWRVACRIQNQEDDQLSLVW